MIDTMAILITCCLSAYVLLRFIALDWRERYPELARQRDRANESRAKRS